MSLFSSLQLASSALRAQQIGIQVVGQNIANANTPGYIREEAVFVPGPTQREGSIALGLGVQVSGVIQKVDRFLENRLRQAGSDRSGSEVQSQTYLQLESLLGELGDTDLSTSLNAFFSSIHDILNQPEDVAVRNLAVLQGQTLAGDINRLYDRVQSLRSDLNKQIESAAPDVNRLIETIRDLNVKISEIEGADISQSDAVGLRDQRSLALNQLSELIDIRVAEQPSGAVNVYAGGDYLVFESQSRTVRVDTESDLGISQATLVLDEIESPLEVSSGKLAGLIAGRDQTTRGLLTDLDSFAATLAFEFNKLYSQGQGLKGYSSLTSQYAVSDTTAALDAAGLAFTPVNGSLQVQVFNRNTGLTTTTQIEIDLDGLNDNDTSLADLGAALNAISGITASVSSATGQLQLAADSSNLEISFANDTSGVLAALGLNVFFNGSTASELRVDSLVSDDPARFAASRTGIGGGTANAVDLADFLERPLETQNGTNLEALYAGLVNNITQQSSIAQSVTEGYRVFEESLAGQHLAISGVSLDEEAIKLLSYQKAFQATAKLVAVTSELLDILVSL